MKTVIGFQSALGCPVPELHILTEVTAVARDEDTEGMKIDWSIFNFQ